MSTLDAGRQLIKAALESGFRVAVHHENDDKPAMTRQGSKHLNDLWGEATACDEAFVYLYETTQVLGHTSWHNPKSNGWAYLVHGNDPEETVSDHSASGWVNEWAQATDYGQREWQS